MNVSSPSARQHTPSSKADASSFSPFAADADHSENVAPPDFESSSPLSPASRNMTSPLRVLKMRNAAQEEADQSKNRSPRKLSSPDRRFPVKVSTPTQNRESRPVETPEPTPRSLDDALQNNEGLTKAMQLMEDDEGSEIDYKDSHSDYDDAIMTHNDEVEADAEGFADETAFSAFSAVPDMTMFSKIGHTPSKSASFEQTPKPSRTLTPLTARRSDSQYAATPASSRQHPGGAADPDTTNLILDFTDQIDFDASANQPSQSPSKDQKPPDLFNYTNNARTPSKNQRQHPASSNMVSNLLDFDIPPAPTPRSMPSVTPRELETLKSALFSEISSLKASLSGRETEVLSLKSAIGDAETRVGATMEQLLDERSLKEQLAVEKQAWEKRGREMEVVLRNVKEEIVHSENEREELVGRFEESEKRREAAEYMAQEAESKMAGMRAVSGTSTPIDTNDIPTPRTTPQREIEVAVERVARELHTLYKNKHEHKVAALKKSYEIRWDRKVKELELKIEELMKENEDMKVGHDATMSGVVPRMPDSDATEELKSQALRGAEDARELQARLEDMSHEIQSIKQDNTQIQSELAQERIEKGELVAACDELLALQETRETTSSQSQSATSGMESLRSSVSRSSGLRPPNFTATSTSNGAANESRIGRIDRTKSGGAPGGRPGSGFGARSGIMSSIERMGSHKGRAT